MVTPKGRCLPPSHWSYTIIEDLFSAVVSMGVQRKGYNIYGHSAGAQFVHRLVQFLPTCRVETAVAANSGWYTMPCLLARWPYGWRGLHPHPSASASAKEDCRRALSVNPSQ